MTRYTMEQGQSECFSSDGISMRHIRMFWDRMIVADIHFKCPPETRDVSLGELK